MIRPEYSAFQKLARRGNLVPVYETFRADLLTPVGAYLRLARDARYSFLLESVEGGERLARYTFLGADPYEVFRANGTACAVESEGRVHWEQANPLVVLRQRLGRFRPVRVPELPPLVGGAIGYFSYDMVRLVEKIPATHKNELGRDDAVLMFFFGLVAFDHVKHSISIVRNVFTEGPGTLRAKYNAAVRAVRETRRILERPLPPESTPPRRGGPPLRLVPNVRKAEYVRAVRQAQKFIRAGDIFQVVLSQRFSARSNVDPFAIYRELRVVNPSPYMYFLRLGDLSVVGSSPEMLLKVQGREAFYRPIAGTVPRGVDEQADQRLEEKLRSDPKERAEHIMLVDLGRNDLGRVCEYGSVRVEDLLAVERYSHVMHLVSSLRGRLRENVDCLDALMACFPAGTLTGAPKVRAMEIIEELERVRRGVYGGAILYCDFSGNIDSCIAIRTLVAKDGLAHVQAGAGIVADSVPQNEHAECVNKARALLDALAAAHGPAKKTRNKRRKEAPK